MFIPAQLHFGICLETGRGVARDYVLAANYYQLGSDQSDPLCQYRLVRLFFVAECFEESAELFELAAVQNLAAAQLDYAKCLRSGKGVDADLPLAAHYNLAARQHDARAQYEYAFCLQHSLGVRKDYQKAAK
jgi:TPR repeat protein